MIYFKDKVVHFIGIGGIGMSAIAEQLKDMSIQVQGSNDVENDSTRRLRAQGIPVFIGQKDPSVLDGADVVIISSAIHSDNVELKAAIERKMPIGHRSEMLAQIMRYKQGIAVAGTHGKTTTSSMISHLMIEGGFMPSCIIGGVMNNYETNSVLGKSDWLVVEADESDGSFLRLNKMVAVVTSMDPEHLDYYGSVDQMNLAYLHFMQTTSFYGFCVVCTDHPIVKEMAEKVKHRRMISYGLNTDAFIHAKNIRIGQGALHFDIVKGDQTYSNFVLPMFGRHNILNALAAFAVVSELGMEPDKIRKAFASFKGVQRRFTKRGEVDGILIYDDYGHHPEEIKATLRAAKEATPDNKVIAVFQPHRYSRFADLMDDFLTAFVDADILLVADVYAAGEEPIEGVNKEAFINRIMHPNAMTINDENDLADKIASMAKAGDLVIGLGAGSISKWVQALPDNLKKRKG